MAYEKGMSIMHDDVTKTILIEFRGVSTVLPGPYLERAEGVIAGEAFCRENGWTIRDN